MVRKDLKNKKIVHFLFISTVITSLVTCSFFITLQISFSREELHISDPNISPNARNLFYNLADLTDSVLFGHQETNFYGLNASDMSTWIDDGSYNYSDVEILTGSHPAVYGFDAFGSCEGIVDGIKAAFSRGGVITVSWHAPNFVTGGSFYDTTGDAVPKILPGGSHHENFTSLLDNIAQYLGNLEYLGEVVPIIFRPWHEYNGNWFWWGSSFCNRQEFIALYRFTVEYLRDTKGVHNFLYAISPNEPFNTLTRTQFLYRYPGDDVIDILALDAYDWGWKSWKTKLTNSLLTVIKLAMERGKLAAFSETGLSQGLSETNVPNWYSDVLLDMILETPEVRNIAYTLVWRNAGYGHFWVPYPGHSQAAGFMEFFNDEHTIFQNNIPAVYAEKTTADNYTDSASEILSKNNITSIIGLVFVSMLLVSFIIKTSMSNRNKKKKTEN
ncbi:MAG: glycoside hydrolase family 26 protein [Promethearchaeota archaeon]